MRRIDVKQLSYDLTPVGGLALVGHYLKGLGEQFDRIDAALPVRGGVANGDILRSYLGLLVQGKSDFDAIEAYRGDAFFKQALGLQLLPSSPTLRQRLDARAAELFDFIPALIEQLLKRQRPDYGLLPCGWLPLDVDTFAMDNSDSRKEGVGRTYAGVDGYCPLAAYLGRHGFCLELALRPGVQHSARETHFNLERLIPLAQRLSQAGAASTSNAPLLLRLDAGFDSAALMACIHAHNTPGLPAVDWLIKWNPRGADAVALLASVEAQAQQHGTPLRWEHPRQGKRVLVCEESLSVPGIEQPLRRVLRFTERCTDRHGQQLLVPELEIEGWSCSLNAAQFSPEQIIALYADHGTHEQFHAEFKSDLDLERLPSGKFDTNYLVCQLAALAMNILRLMGQRGLLGSDAPIRHSAKRRRVKTVIQELIYKAGRFIEHARGLVLGLGASDRGAGAFMRLHGELQAAGSG